VEKNCPDLFCTDLGFGVPRLPSVLLSQPQDERDYLEGAAFHRNITSQTRRAAAQIELTAAISPLFFGLLPG
jgi:hypothetical protein